MLPYFCFYTGLNLVKEARTSQVISATILAFCDTFGDGYIERKNFLAALEPIQGRESFVGNCTEDYRFGYNKAAARFDPLDMSKGVSPKTLCDSIFDMREALSPYGDAGLSDLLRFSYVLSL